MVIPCLLYGRLEHGFCVTQCAMTMSQHPYLRPPTFLDHFSGVCFFLLYLHSHPLRYKCRGVILKSLCLSVWLCPLSISWTTQPCSFFLPNLVWCCVLMRRCVMRKKWFPIFNVKVTVRAYIIKIWLFLLCLLNCCSVCNQTWFNSTAS